MNQISPFYNFLNISEPVSSPTLLHTSVTNEYYTYTSYNTFTHLFLHWLPNPLHFLQHHPYLRGAQSVSIYSGSTHCHEIILPCLGQWSSPTVPPWPHIPILIHHPPAVKWQSVSVQDLATPILTENFSPRQTFLLDSIEISIQSPTYSHCTLPPTQEKGVVT